MATWTPAVIYPLTYLTTAPAVDFVGTNLTTYIIRSFHMQGKQVGTSAIAFAIGAGANTAANQVLDGYILPSAVVVLSGLDWTRKSDGVTVDFSAENAGVPASSNPLLIMGCGHTFA